MNKKFHTKEEIKIMDISLMEDNPRYTITDSDINFLEVEKKVNNQIAALNNLIDSEEGLEKLLNLIISFNSKGFDSTIDVEPFVLEDAEGNYVVVEGNRRIFAMKLLIGDEDSVETLKKYVKQTIPEFKDVESKDAETIREFKNFEENRNKIIEIIEGDSNNKKFDTDSKIEVNLYRFHLLSEDEVELENNSLLEKIVSRHSYTESSLKKEWSRTKMFFELRMRFIQILKRNVSKGTSEPFEMTYKELEGIYSRELSVVKSDVFTAFYVYQIVNIWLDNRQNSKQGDRDKIIKRIKPSGIELSRSKVRQIDNVKSLGSYLSLKNDIRNDIKEQEIDSNYNLLISENENFSWEKLSDFIMTSYLSGNLNTRRFTFCQDELNKDENIIRKYAALFNLTIAEVKSNSICNKENSAIEEKYIEIIAKNNSIKKIYEEKFSEKIIIEDVIKNKITRNKFLTNFVSMSDSIFQAIEHKEENIEQASVVSQALISKYLIEHKLQKNGEIWNKIVELEKKSGKMKPIKRTLLKSLHRLVMIDLQNVVFSDLENLSYNFNTYKLTILNRSLIEMTLVYSSYFHKEEYQKDYDRSKKFIISPKELFQYEDISNNGYSILDFSFDNAKHNMTQLLEKFISFRDKYGNPSIVEKNIFFNELLSYYNDHQNKINKIIHRYWALPNSLEGITNFTKIIYCIDLYIKDTMRIISKQIDVYIDWIENGEDDPKDPSIDKK